MPGGRAPEYLRLDPRVLAIVRHFVQHNKPVAAICHGVQLLTAADVVRGRRINGYPTVEPEVRTAGGEWVELAWDQAVTDGNFVTAPAWSAHVAWLAAFLHLLEVVPTPTSTVAS